MDTASTEGVADLDTSGEHAQLILATANDAFISIDEGGTIVEWNQAAERILGWGRREAVGRPLAETVIPGTFRHAHYAGIERFLETGHGPMLFQTLELAALHRDGSELPVEATIWPSRIAGQLRFNAFLRDVTERARMRAHVELLQRVTSAANAAEDVEQAVRRALEEVAALTHWPVGHAYLRGWTDERLEPTDWWTQGAEPYEEFRAATEQTPFELGVGLPGRVAAEAQPALIGDITQDLNFPREEVASRTGLVSAFAFPVMSQARVVAVLEFYSARPDEPDEELLSLMANIGVQLGRVFERLRWQTQLQEAFEAKSQLLSLLAHEVRTPVTIIEGFADLMLEDFATLDDAATREYVDSIRRHAARLRRLTTNALHVSRLEAGRQRADAQTVALDGFVARVLGSLDLSHVEVTGDRDVSVRVDRDHLEQILINYLTNATAYGAPPVWVDIRQGPAADADAATAVVRVCDRGPGVPSTIEPRLFDSFTRGTTTGGGSGLGLSIARQLAELNAGQTWHEPVAPTGSAFAVRLPTVDRHRASQPPD